MTQGHRGFFASKPATVAQMYGQLISLLDKHEILKFSREKKGERYVKHFDEMHTNIHANEGVTSGIKFTSAATNDSFMLKPTNYNEGDIVALDRAYIDYAKFEEMTRRGVIYVTKIKKNLVYNTLSDIMYIAPNGLMQERVQIVEFTNKGNRKNQAQDKDCHIC